MQVTEKCDQLLTYYPDPDEEDRATTSSTKAVLDISETPGMARRWHIENFQFHQIYTVHAVYKDTVSVVLIPPIGKSRSIHETASTVLKISIRIIATREITHFVLAALNSL